MTTYVNNTNMTLCYSRKRHPQQTTACSLLHICVVLQPREMQFPDNCCPCLLVNRFLNTRRAAGMTALSTRLTAPMPAKKSKKPAHVPQTRDESSVEKLYLELRERAMRYDLRPGARINEQVLGKEFGVSRPPLREALNRLVAEGFFDFVMNKGFFRKSISVEELFNLYQVRIALERRAVFLAVEHASDSEIEGLRDYWKKVMAGAGEMLTADLLLADEEFHRRLAALSHNRELCLFLEQVTRRIHVARHIDLEQSDWNTSAFDAHAQLPDLLLERKLEPALAALTGHIDMSLKRAVQITKEMVAKFFLQDQAWSSSQPLPKKESSD